MAWFWPGMDKTGRLGQTTWFWPAYTYRDGGRYSTPRQRRPAAASLRSRDIGAVEPESAATVRCRHILRMSVATPRCIDWGVLADAGEAAAVREQDDEELPPDIEFSLCGHHFEMSIERFAVYLGIYYEPEAVRDDFTQGLTQGEDGVMRAC
ncbi:hypothetical protein R6Q57_022590 [Mikania cordata]